jgi:energy-coupling factor transporter transmembrane protein EcfT
VIPGAAFAAAPTRATRLGSLHPAVRLAWLVVGVVLAMTAPWPAVAALAALACLGLASAGLGAGAQARRLRPWLPMAALALLVHTLTTTAAAPLGHPSWAGAAAGARALLRLGATVAMLNLHLRTGSLDDLVAALGWWLQPLARLGLRVDDLGLAVAVACGTVPQVVGEGRRLQAVGRLRGHAAGLTTGGGRRQRWRPWRRWLEDARLVVPLLETLARRAETLELALRGRRPLVAVAGAPRLRDWALLGAGMLAAVALGLPPGGH